MSDYQSKKNLISEIYSLLDKPKEPLAPILRRAIKLAILCDKEEYKVLFDIHLDGVKLEEKGRIERWKNENKIPDWNPIDAFYEDRKIGIQNAITEPIEEVEFILNKIADETISSSQNSRREVFTQTIQHEKDLRKVLIKIRNRVTLFLREVDGIDEKPTSENNSCDSFSLHNWFSAKSWIFGLVISLLAMVLSMGWLIRDRDFEPALAVITSFVSLIAIIFNRGIKGLIFIFGFLSGIILTIALFYTFPQSQTPVSNIENKNKVQDDKTR